MYAKIFAQMYDGSLCTHGTWEALVTFQQFLVLADQEGAVDMTAEAISRRTTIPMQIIRKGILELLKPDPHSRTPSEEGRRIVPLSPDRDWGWMVVNYKHYRALKRECDRREYHREYWHKRKTQQTQQTQPNQPIAEAEAEAKRERARKPIGSRLTPDWNPGENGRVFALKRGIQGAEFQEQAARFTDYWSAQPGQKGIKTDWDAMWRNWIRKAVEFNAVKDVATQTVPSTEADRTAEYLREQREAVEASRRAAASRRVS
jgi:hypothetical protein